MVFQEDEQHKRDKRAADNFAIISKIVLNLLKKDTATKAPLVSKRLKTAWNKDLPHLTPQILVRWPCIYPDAVRDALCEVEDND